MTAQPIESASAPTPEKRAQPSYFWTRVPPKAGPDGADLAALRRGAGRPPGSVPAMWRFYTALSADGGVSPRLAAEHHALTLYAIHQQSQSKPMHQQGNGVGSAAKALRASGTFSPDAVDRRLNAAATATSLEECAYHLRGLVRQFKQIGQPLDYSALVRDLTDWQYPERAARVRRRWGSQYFLGRGDSPAGAPADGAQTTI